MGRSIHFSSMFVMSRCVQGFSAGLINMLDFEC